MRRLLTFASLLLLTGCGPRYCAMGVPNPFYDRDNMMPAVTPEQKILWDNGKSPRTDPGGSGRGTGGAESAAAPHPEGPPMVVASAGSSARQSTPARPPATNTHAAPVALASRTVSSPQRADEPDDFGYDAGATELDEDYVRPRAGDRDLDRGRSGWRPNRPSYGRDEYVTRNARPRDRSMYGDDHRTRDRGDRPNRRRRDHGDNYADSGRGQHGDRNRGDRERGGRNNGGRNHEDGARRHVNRYDGAEMASAGQHKGRRGEGRRDRQDDADRADRRRDRRNDRDHVG